MTEKKNKFIVPLDEFRIEKSDTQEDWYVAGYASLPNIDAQQERILQNGLDISDFLQYGYFNWDHSHSPSDILAYPIVDATKIDEKGFYTTGRFLKTEGAKRVIELWKALNEVEKTMLGMSIEGVIIKRNDFDPRTIEKAVVKWVAITPRAVNKDTVKSFQIFAKSIIGIPEAETPAIPEPAVVKENIEKEPKPQTYTIIWKKTNKAIVVPDPFTLTVIDLVLNNGLDLTTAEFLARKFTSALQPIIVNET